MSSKTVMKLMVGFYIFLFFLYLFGPLLLMGAAAFNSSSFPQVTPWEGFTWQWFTQLAQDDQMIEGIQNSLWIGLGVVCLSVPIGLAASLMMNQIYERVRPIYYMIVVSPVLTPGVILGRLAVAPLIPGGIGQEISPGDTTFTPFKCIISSFFF